MGGSSICTYQFPQLSLALHFCRRDPTEKIDKHRKGGGEEREKVGIHADTVEIMG